MPRVVVIERWRHKLPDLGGVCPGEDRERDGGVAHVVDAERCHPRRVDRGVHTRRKRVRVGEPLAVRRGEDVAPGGGAVRAQVMRQLVGHEGGDVYGSRRSPLRFGPLAALHDQYAPLQHLHVLDAEGRQLAVAEGTVGAEVHERPVARLDHLREPLDLVGREVTLLLLRHRREKLSTLTARRRGDA